MGHPYVSIGMKKKKFMLQSTHKMANLNQNEICAVLCLKRQYQQHDEKIFVCQRDQEHDILSMTINKYDITLRRHLEFKIQISTLDSLFLPSFHVTLLVNYVRLNCRVKFYLKTNNAFKMLPFLGTKLVVGRRREN